jgi:hypothetical protein
MNRENQFVRERAGVASERETVETPAVTQETAEAIQHRRLFTAYQNIMQSLYHYVDATMPDSAYRDMFLWGLNPANPHAPEWLQVIGTRQIVYFAAQVMGSMFGEEELTVLVHHATPMNIYLTFEVISDNLAFGLTDRQNHDETYYLRQHLMSHFNRRMCTALKYQNFAAWEALDAERGVAERISVFEQSLSPAVHARLAEAFLRQHPGTSLYDLEYGLHPLLVTNFQACLDLYRSSEQMQMGKIIQRGLYHRYATAERVLHNPRLDMSRLVKASTYAILIMPVVAHYLEGVANEIGLADRLPAVIHDHLIFRTLYDAAMLIRLLNDIGTNAILNGEQRETLLMDLMAKARRVRSNDVYAFLREVADEQGVAFNRIGKDVKHGEFNMALYNMQYVTTVQDAVYVLGERLQYFSNLYEERFVRLKQRLMTIAERLGDDRLSGLILRAILFHEKMYAKDYRTDEGEYATAEHAKVVA